MKRATTLLLITLASSSAVAQQAPATATITEREKTTLSAILPVCGAPPSLTRKSFPSGLPSGFTSSIVTVESDDVYCAGTYALIQKGLRTYVGMPWPLSGYQGSVEEKIRSFAWDRMKASVAVNLSSERTTEGLLRVTLLQKTEYGSIPLEGAVDERGSIFLPGAFHSSPEDLVAQREKTLAAIVAPSKGKNDAPIRIVEFSDFECPSCRFASEYMPALLAKYGERVRYSRIDMPLVSMHPWAFPASMYGRAIWRQKPEAFWSFKEAVYTAQSDLNTFTLDDFARDFASKNGLDAKKFDEDLASESLKKELLAGIGAANFIGIAGTPTFVVNGRLVTGGEKGKSLEKYLDQLIAASK